jgi:putative sigma-54 modulation protein
MKFVFTSRHFKAHDNIKQFAQNEIEKITKFYDGIIRGEVILSFEKSTNSVKIAELILTTNTHHVLTAKERSDDFLISIEGAADKMEAQLKKIKEKLKFNHTRRAIPFKYIEQ